MDKKDIAKRLKELKEEEAPRDSSYTVPAQKFNQLIENLEEEASQEDLMGMAKNKEIPEDTEVDTDA